ncbi:MAG: universal stress protein [Pseudomonadota bacterium]
MASTPPDTKVITACIDGSANTAAVCDAAAWAGRSIDAPIRFLHVVEPDSKSTSGAGERLLEDTRDRAVAQGALGVAVQQRHGRLVETLQTCEPETRLFVIGRRGVDNAGGDPVLGSQVEAVARTITRPILTTVGVFEPPRRWMLAFDGSVVAATAVTRVARSPILKGLPGHVVMVGEDTNVNRAQLEAAAADLRTAGHVVTYHLLRGDVVDALLMFCRSAGVGLMVMGAFGHSRVRGFFVGSNTERMITRSAVPLLLLR